MHVWLNGEFVDRDTASVSVLDAGFQHGVGLFETMLARNGCVFRVEAHLARLADSAKELLLTQRLRTEPLAEAIHATLKKNDLEQARVRLTITGGSSLSALRRPLSAWNAEQEADDGERGAESEKRKAESGKWRAESGKQAVDPTILIVAQPPTQYPQEFFEQGVMATIADGRDNPLHPMAGHKTLNYWPRIKALQEAAAKRAGEAIWFTVSNHLASGSVSNVFLIKDGALLTPIARGEEQKGAIPSCVLPGITRSAIFEIAESMSIEVRKRMLDIKDLLSADEVFLTNSSWGVLPVVGVEREKIAAGKVGALTRKLREKWLALTS